MTHYCNIAGCSDRVVLLSPPSYVAFIFDVLPLFTHLYYYQSYILHQSFLSFYLNHFEIYYFIAVYINN